MIGIVVLCAIIAAVGTAVALVGCRRREERFRCYSAARVLLQNEILDCEIQNQVAAAPTSCRILLYLRVHTKPVKKYVLDPRKGILFGRDIRSCDVLLNEAVISEHQCCIREYQGALWLTDLNSANGTVIRKGAFRTLTLRGGQSVRLKSGDRLLLGRVRFDLILFRFDSTMM